MNSPLDSAMDEMLARAVLEDHGHFRFITIPGIETLSEPEQIALAKKAEQRLVSSAPFDPDALLVRSRLQAITPPLDPEEEDEESRVLEAQARKDLESDGCPACYPAHLDVPVRNPPEEYQPIIDYWHSLASTGDVVLCAQKADWRDFRAFQARVRRRDPSVSSIVDDARERRRRRGLGGDVDLLPDPQQQTRQQNWLEFQNYHLRRHERLGKKRDGLMEGSACAHKDAGDPDPVACERAAQIEETRLRSLEFTERTLRWHDVLLGWIEQQRLAMMEPEPPTRLEDEEEEDHRDDRNALPVTSDAIMPSSPKIPRSPPPPPPKRRHAREQRIGPLRAPRVSKAKRLGADAGAKSRRGTRSRSRPRRRRRPVPRTQLDSRAGPRKTRNGRLSRLPERWAPG